MRARMDMELETLHYELISMGEMCKNTITYAISALTSGNQENAANAVEMDAQIDEKEREIESLCLKFMLRQQPVAKDLRKVSSALKMITDMERIGDQARDIAEITYYVNLQNQTGLDSLQKMADATSKMVTDSIDAFVRQDLELALLVIDSDDIVDDYFLKIRKELIELIQKNGDLAESGLDLLMIAKYFERIGDHATNIAEWVEFSITGKHDSDKNK